MKSLKVCLRQEILSEIPLLNAMPLYAAIVAMGWANLNYCLNSFFSPLPSDLLLIHFLYSSISVWELPFNYGVTNDSLSSEECE